MAILFFFFLAREKEATATPPTTSSAATEAQATHAHSGSLPKISSSWAGTPDEEVPLTPAALPSAAVSLAVVPLLEIQLTVPAPLTPRPAFAPRPGRND